MVPTAGCGHRPVSSGSREGGVGTFFRMHHQKGRVSFVFRQWGMRGVEVDFRQE